MEKQSKSILLTASKAGEEFYINKKVENSFSKKSLLYTDVDTDNTANDTDEHEIHAGVGGDTAEHQGGDAGDREHGDDSVEAISANPSVEGLFAKNSSLAKLIEGRGNLFSK